MKKYLLEIKNRATFILLNILINVFIIYFYKEILLFLIIKSSNFNLYTFYFIFTDVTEIFKIYFKMILFLSIQIFLLMSIYHCFLFLSPALFVFEYIKFKIFIKIIFCMWLLNILFSHNFIIPITWNFFFNFHNSINFNSFVIHFEAKLSEYFNFYTTLYYLSLLYFYFLVLLLLLLNFISSKTCDFKKFRKLYYLIFFFFSTLISPPDILSQFILSFLLITIHEFMIFSLILKNNLIP